MDDLIRQLREFNAERDWEQFHSPKNLAMAFGVEVAEIMEHFQWLTEEESRRLPADKVAQVREEIGDSLINLLQLADELGIDPLSAARDKLEKNRQKYPASLARGKALKYTEYEANRE